MESLYQHNVFFMGALLMIIAGILPSSSSSFSSTTTRRFQFNVEWKEVTRLCHTKPLLTVNGEYPGPTIAVHEGDNVEIKVTNRVAQNTTIHWHGVRQFRTGWADGPAYITQCPIRGGHSYTYKFNVKDQRGTLFWHAHHLWQRASVYGAFIIYPPMPYPFSTPIQSEIPILFGEWWNNDVDAVEKEMMKYRAGPQLSDAYTINSLPGPLYPCSTQDTFVLTVERGKTYMLRIINAALNIDLFFAIANHTFTVVEVDGVYTKSITTTAIMIAPGQTTTLLLTAYQVPDSTGMFVMAARPYVSSIFEFHNSTTIGFLQYKNRWPRKVNPRTDVTTLQLYNLPEMKDTSFVTKFSNNLKSLASPQYPCNVPQIVDKRVITTISVNLQDCPANQTCKAREGKRLFASMNNQSFIHPSVSILKSYYKNKTTGIFSSDFPENPPKVFDYTGVDAFAENMNAELGTKLLVVPYGTVIEIVFQDTSFLSVENHPIHVHGHNFFIVGSGFGNFNATTDPKKYNLVDPLERNTVSVPTGGWAAIRFKADNPGVWFVHCHFESHTSWGLSMVFIVKNGPDPSQQLLPPPQDLPSC